LAAKDHVAALLVAALGGAPVPPESEAALVAQLEALTIGPGASFAAEPTELSVDYLVCFQPDPAELAILDLEPALLVEDLRALGSCTVLAAPTLVPSDDGLSSWRFIVTTGRGEDAIRDVFIFVAGAGELTIERGVSLFGDDDDAAAEPDVIASR